MSCAIIPGSYDPITIGHLEMIRRTAKLYDKVIVLSAINKSKKYLFCDNARLALIKDAIKDIDNACAMSYSGLLVDFCAANDNPVIVKGVRDSKDFSYESEMAELNKFLGQKRHGINVETMLMISDESYKTISSSKVKICIETGTDYDELVPNPVLLKELLAK